MAACKTVRIADGKGGSIVINEEDYDPKIHKLFVRKPKKKPKPNASSEAN